MTDVAQLNVAITASDKTGKGKKAAEKNLGQIPKHVSAVNRRAAADDEKRVAGAGRSMVRTLGSVEQASSRLFGGRSITGGLTSRLGALRDVTSSVGTGMGEAATAGGMLEGAVAGVGVAVGATVGVLAAAAYGAFKLADGWSRGAAAIGRTAEIAGVSAKALQELNAAGERVGVDKATSSGALGGLSQTLNDARYGRNNEALAVLARIGVKLQTKEDGTVDVEAMLPQIADAVARQNSSGRRTLASKLGFGQAALPLFTQGGKALSADMADADKNAPMIGDAAITMAKRNVRKGAMIGQSKDRLASQAGEAIAGAADRNGVYDAAVDGGRYFTGSVDKFTGSVTQDFKPGATKIDRAGEKMERAATVISGSSGGQIGLTRSVIAAAQAAERKTGIPAAITLGQFGLESSYGRHMPAGSNNPFGIKARSGEPYVMARTREEDRFGRSYYVNARFRKFDNLEQAFEAHAQVLLRKPYAKARAKLPDVDDFADALTGTYATDHLYGSKLKGIIRRQGFDRYDGGGGVPEPIPVHVTVEHRNAPPGTRTTVKAGKGHAPAVSHAFEPVHGG